MAGDWIKMRLNLATDPAVIGIAERTDSADEDHVVGKLHRLWSWADQQTIDGNAPSVTKTWIDRYLAIDGFADAMIAVGWLVVTESGIEFPNFTRHNGQTAKQRALTSKRVARHKRSANAEANAPSVTKTAKQRYLQKRREEKRREERVDHKEIVSCSWDSNQVAQLQARAEDLFAKAFDLGAISRKPRDTAFLLKLTILIRDGLLAERWVADAVEAIRNQPGKIDNPLGYLHTVIDAHAKNNAQEPLNTLLARVELPAGLRIISSTAKTTI